MFAPRLFNSTNARFRARIDRPLAKVHVARRRSSPLRALAIRFAAALSLIAFTVVVVYAGRGGYRDNAGGSLSLLDACYYSVVSLSTTGYGDITPVTPAARLVNVVLVTPARVLFLIILVGTTLEVLTEQYRGSVRLTRWRRRVKNHVVVCGYGTKGRSAIDALRESGFDNERLVVVEKDGVIANQATLSGLTTIEGDATRAAVLQQACISRATAIIVAPASDDAAVLMTLTARQLTQGQPVRIVAAAREAENAPLLKQSGAHQVVVSSATTGRLLGLSTTAPPVLDAVEDLLTPGEGMALAVRSVIPVEVGRSPRELHTVVLALVRDGRLCQLDDSETSMLQVGDKLIYVRDDRHADATNTGS